MSTLIGQLASATPYLAVGFAVNLCICVTATLFGMVVGVALGRLRDGQGALARFADRLTALCRLPPTLVLLFFFSVLLLLDYLSLREAGILPAWLTAALVLSIPVIGFASDRFLDFRRHLSTGEHGAELIFAAAWARYAPILLMASATAWVIGAEEIFFRANNLVAESTDAGLWVMTYGYVSLWFLAACLILKALGDRVAQRSVLPRLQAVRLQRQRRRKPYQPRKIVPQEAERRAAKRSAEV